MQIRLAEKKDAKPIAEIIKRHFETDYMGFANFDEAYIKEKMKKDAFFVAEDDGKIIACIRTSIVDIDLAEIRTLCVDREFQRKGIANMLIDEAIRLLMEKKMRKIIARAKAGNIEAINLFKKNGFEQEGYFKEHYRQGIDVVQLYRFL